MCVCERVRERVEEREGGREEEREREKEGREIDVINEDINPVYNYVHSIYMYLCACTHGIHMYLLPFLQSVV